MRVFHDLNDLPKFKNAVLTIGSFDGVHHGHQQILERINHLASDVNGESIVITFHPHPRLVVYPKDKSLRLITSINEKINLLKRYGVDNVVIVPFTIEFSQQSADEYIQKFLLEKFDPSYIVIGYDHRFGLNRQGDINYLKWHASKSSFKVLEIEKQEVQDIAVSSTKVRKALEKGDVAEAARLSNHYVPLSGIVVHGQKIGASIGFPTANVQIADPHKLIPPFGIYAVYVEHQGERYGGMLYIGDRPVLKEHNNRTIEVNIFNFNKNIYGDPIKIELVDYIRGNTAFDGLEELQAQLRQDQIDAEKILEKASFDFKETDENEDLEPKVAVVILNYNGKEYLKKFLPFVSESSYPNVAIYVADNGSDDDSLVFLKNHFPKVRRIDLLENHGFAQGYNLALKQIKADYYVLLNSDVEVSPNWLEPIVELLERDETIAAAQPKILSYSEKSQFEYAGAAGGWIDKWAYPFCRGRVFSEVEKDVGQYDETSEIFWASGAALFIRPHVFHEIGGFDGDYFAHMEEIDLCWRIKRAGFKVVACPASVVYHVGGGTLQYNSPRKSYLNFRNSLYTIVKNEEKERLFIAVLWRLILDGAAGLMFLFQMKLGHLLSIFKAHWVFFANLPKYLKKRKMFQDRIDKISISEKPILSGRLDRSVVMDFYLKGKKVFSKINEDVA